MKRNHFFKYLLVITILSNLAFECGCKKTAKQISHLNVSITFKQAVIYLEEERVPFTLTIKSNDELAKDLKYTCVDWRVKDNLGKLVNASEEAIDPEYELVYGDNQLYYQPHAEGKHILEITVSDENGSIKKKELLTINVKDHLPVDFQVEIKPEKSAVFIHEPVKLLLDISSRQKEAVQLTYQIKEISTDKKGTFSATGQGKPIDPNHELSYGKNTLYYNNIDKQPGTHDIKLLVANSKGDIQVISASLNILDTDFQVKPQLQKPAILFYEKAKLIVDITSKQEGMDKLTYQIKTISTSAEGGEFLATADGSKISSGHALVYGQNTLYYHPSQQLGTHHIKIEVTNSNGNTKIVQTSLEVLNVDFQVKFKPEKSTIFFYEQAKLKLEIISPQEGGDKLNYQVQELSTNQKGYLSLTSEGKAIGEKQSVSYGKSELYYHPQEQLGNHEITLTVTNGNGITKTASASLQVLDIDFQVKIKPENTQTFSHDPIKLIVQISSKQEGGQQLICQLKEISTSVQEGEFLTAATDGTPIMAEQPLKYGANTWYYIPHQPGKHEIQLIVVSSHGTTKQANVSLNVLDPDFQLEIKPEKSTAFSHEQVKLMINISSTQEGVDKLAYQLKEVNTSIEAGQLSATPEGSPVPFKQTLQYGKNVWYYTPHQPGSHTIQLVVVNNKGITKEAKALVIVNQAIFSAEAKIEKPSKSTDTSWEIRLLLRSNSNLKEEKWKLGSYQIEEPMTGKLQDTGGYQVAEEGVLLQPGVNKFNLVLSEGIELKNIPQLKLVIIQPDGKEKQVAVDLSSCVFAQLGKPLKLLEEQYQVACKKVMNKEPSAQDRLDAVVYQLKPLRSNLNILSKSTAINRGHLEDASATVDQMLHHSNEKALVGKAVQNKFGRGINEKDQHGRTPLIEAIDKRDLDGIDLVLRHPDVDLKVRHPFKNSTVPYPVLSYVILQEGNDVTILEKLLKAGASVNDRVLINRQSLCDYPVEKPEWSPRHRVSSQESQGETALHVAAAAKLMEPIALLLTHGANINDKNSYWQTPLHLATYPIDEKEDELTPKLVQYLIDHGAFIDAQDLNDNTPLHYAAFRLWRELDRLLEKNGADTDKKNWVYGKDGKGRQLDEEGKIVEDMWN